MKNSILGIVGDVRVQLLLAGLAVSLGWQRADLGEQGPESDRLARSVPADAYSVEVVRPLVERCLDPDCPSCQTQRQYAGPTW
jgi:hypothetical protein